MTCTTGRQRRSPRGQLSALLLAAAMACAGSCTISDAQSAGNKDDGPAKVAAELIALYDDYSNYLASGKPGVFKPANSLVRVVDDRVVIDAVASGDAGVLKADLEGLGMQHGVAFGRVVSGELPIASIPRLKDLASLNFARAASARLHGRAQSLAPEESGR